MTQSARREANPDHRYVTPTEPQVFLRPLGTPIPLGFLGLMVATSSIAALQLGWIPVSESHTVALSALLFAVPLQALASVLGFWSRDPIAGTGIGVLAGTWALLGFSLHTSPPGASSAGLGVMLFAASAALLVPVLSGRKKMVASLVMLVAAARFAVTGVYEVTGSSGWQTTAGWVGIGLGAVALYGALAFELEGSFERTLLPTGRTSPVPSHGEPGVRRVL